MHLMFQLLAMFFPFCVGNNSCSKFKCSNIESLEYPFWGGSQPPRCGLPDFELNCQHEYPILNISSVSYQVMEINNSTQTLLVARLDLSEIRTTCPDTLYNTTLKSPVFQFSSTSTHKNITLFFNCTWNMNRNRTDLPNQFTCNTKGVNLFKKGDASGGPGPDITCNNNIYVPINPGAFHRLKDADDLHYALRDGFPIQYYTMYAINPYRRPCSQANNCQRDHNMNAYGPSLSGWEGNPEGSSRQGTDSDSGRPVSIVLILGLVVGITITVILIIIILSHIKRPVAIAVAVAGQDKELENLMLYYGSLSLRRYKYYEIKKMTKSFSDKLGQGGYGSVYKGMLPNGCHVAVKLLIQTKSNGEEFINEVASISRTSHVNIVSLLGFCYERNKRALVYEFMPNKSLDRFICNAGSLNVDCHLDWGTLYKIAIGVAKGLEYLHSGCNTRIVHFDIKPQNILLDGDFCPKISDFGLAKLCKMKQSIFSVFGARGTIGYIAPEMFLTNFGGVSHKSDVYSYGMMVLEMARGRKNTETQSTEDSSYFPDQIYENFLGELWEEENDKHKRRMFLTGFWCIQTAPSERPSMSKVVEMLEGEVESIKIPPKPVLFSPTHELSMSMSFSADTECLLKDDVHS